MPKRSNVTGGRETAAAMRKIVPGLSVPLNEASRRALKPMLAATRHNAPVDTGALKRSLAIKKARSPKIRPVHLIGPRSDYQEGDDRPVRYAHILEFGRAPNSDGKGGMPGTRFMTKAFEATAQQVLRILEKELPEAVERRVVKLAARQRSGKR